MDHREMTALAGDPPRLRALAAHLLRYAEEDLGAGSRKFLTEMSSYDGTRRLGVAALEALYGLRERAKRYRVIGPYRVARMVREVYERSADIVEEETVDWIGALQARGDAITVSRSEALRLIAVARDVDVVGREEWIDLT